MGLGGIQEEGGGSTTEPAARACWPGTWQKIGEGFAQSDLYFLPHQQKGQWVDIRSNEFWMRFFNMDADCLHIETGSPISTDEQLMFEAASGSNKGHVYGFGSQFAAITAERQADSNSSSSVSSISFAAAHKSCTERERRLWGYM
ncbi:hypothetical protein M9H77_09187 [Catharanthus roseus]|uniref:Uncharacterized protein n=1 Tax=Catharanthus roseus TaxID=4058 RepID=A0ACC0C073_CATRO|nr:hypothetical protein M9H77_09187 [Catharanthus roseus]